MRIATRPPSSVSAPSLSREDLDRVAEDAAHYPGGHASAIVRPQSIDEVSAALRNGDRILPIGAQSSLTGGATPFGEIVLVTDRLTSIHLDGDRVRAGAGVPLQTLQDELSKTGRWFPPVPTYLGAFVGGAVATCAAGAATFKYGTVREWVEGLTVVLAGGDVLTLSRGERVAKADTFEIQTSTGIRIVKMLDLKMPDVPKRSAGYHLGRGMDLIDLFIGSEGTLGVIAEVVLKRRRCLPQSVARSCRCHPRRVRSTWSARCAIQRQATSTSRRSSTSMRDRSRSFAKTASIENSTSRCHPERRSCC